MSSALAVSLFTPSSSPQNLSRTLLSLTEAVSTVREDPSGTFASFPKDRAASTAPSEVFPERLSR